MSSLAPLHKELIGNAMAWAARRSFDRARNLSARRQALADNHNRYLSDMPAYAKLAAEEGVGKLDANSVVETVSRRMMSTDDIFKSYQQRWLDDGDFASMTQWLSQLHHRRIELDTRDIHSIDGWIAGLRNAGVRPVYSSGTSGRFSFIPRDADNWALTRMANTCFLLPMYTHHTLGSPLQRSAVKLAARFLSPQSFARLTSASSAKPYDGVLLDFRSGGSGMQSIGRELGPVFRKSYFLYEAELTAQAMRSLTRGALNDGDRATLAMLQHETIDKRADNFDRLCANLADATRDGQRIFMFGAPFQFKEWCEHILAAGKAVVLNPGSAALFGGGWKTFSGERLPREQLTQLIADAFGLPAERILEGYSMTEINVFMARCDHGRFHIPPIIEPLLFDEALEPLALKAGATQQGIFGFLDPLAVSYPGFIISGDEVTLVDGDCDCGLCGPAITSIARAQHQEVKGCGGVMASVRA